MQSLPSNKDIQDRIHKAYHKLTRLRHDGTRCPFVCSVCDEFITSGNDVYVVEGDFMSRIRNMLQWDNTRNAVAVEQVKDQFSCVNVELYQQLEHDLSYMDMSPRATVMKKQQGQNILD